MNNAFWQVLGNTPWWVYVVFVFLIYVGINARKPRILPVRQLVTLPSIFLVLSFIGLYEHEQLSSHNIFLWLIAMLPGIFLGWLQFHALRIKAIKNTNTLYVPGSWLILGIVMLIFIIKYYIGYREDTDTHFIEHAARWMLLLYGFFTGLFIGRLAYAVRCIKFGPYAELE
jgi:hypothetical protein